MLIHFISNHDNHIKKYTSPLKNLNPKNYKIFVFQKCDVSCLSCFFFLAAILTVSRLRTTLESMHDLNKQYLTRYSNQTQKIMKHLNTRHSGCLIQESLLSCIPCGTIWMLDSLCLYFILIEGFRYWLNYSFTCVE